MARRDRLTAAPPPPTGTSLPRWLGPVLVVTAAVLGYANAVDGPFVFDDLPAIVHHAGIRSLADPMAVLFPHGGLAVSGRPLVGLSLAINYAVGGYNPAGYHVFNIAVHALAAVILCDVLRRVFTLVKLAYPDALAVAAALLWTVHPLNVDTVTYIINRSEGMMATFALAAIWAFLRSLDSPRPGRWLAASTGLAIGSAMCKEVGAMVPLLILLLDVLVVTRSWVEPFRRRWGYYASLLLVWMTTIALLASVNLFIKTGGGTERLTPWIYLQLQAEVVLRYLQLAFWPAPLCVCYVDWPVPRSLLDVLPEGLVILTVLATTAWLIVRKHPAGLIGAWVFIVLAPTSSIIPLGSEVAAERRMYLPLMAIMAGMVVAGALAIRRLPRPQTFAAVVVACLALVLGMATVFRNDDFSSALALWADTVNKRPANPRAQYNLGCELYELGDHQAAMDRFALAVQAAPGYQPARVGLGMSLEMLGDRERATAELQEAIRQKPDDPGARAALAWLLQRKGDYDAAEAILQDVLARDPEYHQARTALEQLREERRAPATQPAR